ncbi:MAG TPA: MFS domain-containing histidine kinase [Marmoricola sp.]
MTGQPARARDRGKIDAGAPNAPLSGRALVRIGLWATAYLLTAWAGQATVVGDSGFPLFWPASGCALVWIITSDPRTRTAELALLGVLAATSMLVQVGAGWQAVNALLGVPLGMAAFVATSRRWSPEVCEGRGSQPVDTLRGYGALVAATVVAGLVEAGVAVVLLGPDPGVLLEQTAELTLAHVVGMVALGVTGIIVYCWFTGLPRGRWPLRLVAGIRRDSTPRDLALATLAFAVTVLAMLAGFLWFTDSPVSFVLMMIVVGVGIWFSAVTTGAFALVVIGAVCWFTVAGRGPIAGIAEPHRQAIAFAIFTLALVVTGLTVSLSRRERDETIARLRESEHAAEVLADDLSLVLANLEEGVAVVEEGGRFIHSNAAIGRLLAMPEFNRQEVEPVGVYHLRHADGRPLEEEEVPHVRVFNGEDDVHDVLYLDRPDLPGARVFEVAARLLPQIRSADKPRAVTTIRDVTAEHRQRDALTSFAQVVAHDLRSPLASVELWARELLESYAEGPVDATTCTMMVEHIVSSTNRMQNFISDLLAYALARDQAMSPTRVRLTDVVDAIVETIDAVEGTTPEVRYEALPEVWCDPVLVPQLFDNLIGNARKYVAEGVVPRVRIEAEAAPGQWTRIRVLDNGIGIAPEDRVRVFESFERAHAMDYEGTGLGLAICRHIVRRHGGTIGVVTAPEATGTCIELTLPLTEDAFDSGTSADR